MLKNAVRFGGSRIGCLPGPLCGVIQLRAGALGRPLPAQATIRTHLAFALQCDKVVKPASRRCCSMPYSTLLGSAMELKTAIHARV
jgi:hypothetical protein